MTISKEEIGRVARKLTAARKEVLMSLTEQPRRPIDFKGSIAARMRFTLLIDRNITRTHGRRTAWYFLTPLGAAVRAHLLSETQS